MHYKFDYSYIRSYILPSYVAHTCTIFQKGASSATGSVATEQPAPIIIIWVSADVENIWSIKLRVACKARHCMQKIQVTKCMPL